MLTIDNIRQILDEHEVFLRDPEARGEHLDRALFAMGVRRAELRRQVPRLDDGVFVSWAICLPFHKQPHSYSDLMRSRRKEWFYLLPPDIVAERARIFFTPEFLRFDLDQLADLVTAEDAAVRIGPYLGEMPDDSSPSTTASGFPGPHSPRITLATGEALVGEGNEVAHIDLLIGSKSGPVGAAFAHAFVNESEGHTNLLAMVTPNLPAKPDTVITNKVTIKGARQAVQLFGPAQAAVARAVVDSVSEGVIPKDQVDDLVIVVGVFIHWEAEDDQKIFSWNYEAVKMSIARAMRGEPSTDKVLAETPEARHPFAGGSEATHPSAF